MIAPKTVHLVPLGELADFARLVRAMRRAQDEVHRLRADGARVAVIERARRAAKDQEARVDSAAAKIFQRERVSLPMFEEAEGGRDEG